MNNVIRIPHGGKAKELLLKAGNEVSVGGDEKSGLFSYAPHVKGKYEVDDKDIILTITKKPWTLPSALIERVLLQAMMEEEEGHGTDQ